MTPEPAAKHSRPLVALHWAVAALVLTSLVGGWVVLRGKADTDPTKLGSLARHMAIGATIGALTLARLVVRRRGHRAWLPDETTTLAGRGANWLHLLSYVLVLGMVATGFATALTTGLNQVVFGGGGDIPASLAASPVRAAHAAIAWLVFGFVAIHVGAVLWHQLRGRRILGRMLP